MPGVRIRHRTAANTQVVVVDVARPYPTPYLCLPCDTLHPHKTYHLWLDDTGTVIVSEGLWGNLRRVADTAGFVETSPVRNPPDQVLDLGSIPHG